MDDARSALIIASDSYSDPGLRRLRAPAGDAQALAAVLRNPGIGGFEVRTLLNEPAHAVSLAIEGFFADRRPGDLLLVHFSCHGIKDEDGELYFAMANTLLGRLGATAVAAEFVSRRMSRSRSRRVVLLLDCCYAGAFERGLVARAGTEMGIGQQFGGRGRAVITASSAMEYAFEGDELADTRELAPSVFTSALVEGLQTGDADRDQDGLVGLDELYDYVYDKVRVATPNQTPGKWTFGVEGELYIARRSRPVTTPTPLPRELEQAIESPLAGIRAGAVQELAGVLRGRHAGMALAAQLALERLTDDDSRTVAAAAAAALGPQAPAAPPEPMPPELALSATIIDFGRLPAHSQAPERRVRIGNAGAGPLNARAATSVSWLQLRLAGDELVVEVDTSAVGEHEGTITVDSDRGSATIFVQAQVDPMPLAGPKAAATTHPAPMPEIPIGAQPGQQPDPAPSMPSSAGPAAAAPVDAAPPAAASAPTPVTPASEAVAGPTVDPVQPSVSVGHRVAPQASDDRRPPVTDGPGPGQSKEAPQATGPRRFGHAIPRRLVFIFTGAAFAVAGLLTAVLIASGLSHDTATPGTARWVSTTGGEVISRPAVSDGTTYISSLRAKLYAMDAATGHLRWTHSIGGGLNSTHYAPPAANTDRVRSSPAVSAGTVYIGGAGDGKVYALDAATGHLRWTHPTGGRVYSSPAVDADVVYIGSGDGKVYALDAATGHLRWTHPTGGAVYSSPAVDAGTVYIGGGDGKVYALDAATGHLRWTHPTGGAVYSSPAVDAGTVYIGGGDGKVYALDAATRHLRWTHPTGGAVYSSPAVDAGTVYIGGGDGNVYALDAATGHLRWTHPTGATVYSSPAVDAGTVYIGSFYGKVYALDAATGHLRWTHPTGGRVDSSPAVDAGTVYIGSTDHNVYALATGS